MTLAIANTISQVRDHVRRWRQAGLSIGFVPTMGYLHQGHLSLIDKALEHTDKVVVSIFVNPTQFGENEDLDRYPRDTEGDIEKVRQAGASLVFLPSVEMMYPPGAQTYVEVQEVTRPLCGVTRTHHFRGVTTIVSKLFNIVQPDVAVFGKKDYQQFVTIQRMVEDLNFPIQIVGSPTIREKDGLAMSSRNVNLSSEERAAARALNLSLRKARELFAAGEIRPERLLAEATAVIEAYPQIDCEYLELRDSHQLQLVREKAQPSDRIFIAAKIGNTRLIDNAPLGEPCTLDAIVAQS